LCYEHAFRATHAQKNNTDCPIPLSRISIWGVLWRQQPSALRATFLVSALASSNPAMPPSDAYIFFRDEYGEFIE